MATAQRGEGTIAAELAACGRAHLERILESPQFRSSRRCSSFLRYVVEQATEGRIDALKERTIGVEVFDRDPDYDTNQDPVVRSTAGEVRKRLAQYYTGCGSAETVRIALPTGTYVPDIHVEAAPVPAPAAIEAAPVAMLSRPRRRWVWMAAATAVFAAIAAAGVLLSGPNDLEAFWDPAFAPKQPLLVCVGQPHVYKFAGDLQDRMNAWFDQAGAPPPPVGASDVIPLWDRFLALGDIQAFSRLSGFAGKHGKQIDMRGMRSVSLADLRSRPVLLIGAFNNDWTLSFGGDLRFYFEHDSKINRDFIRDRHNPSNREWNAENSPTPKKLPADYALAMRFRNPTTEQTVIVAAGITEYGTQAASEFLTTPEYFAEAVKRAPADWQRKNMQIVLSAKVMSGTAGPPRVLAVHFW
jgi:hypothetical protein